MKSLPRNMSPLVAGVISLVCVGTTCTPGSLSRAKIPPGWIALSEERGDGGWARTAMDNRTEIEFVLVDSGEFVMGRDGDSVAGLPALPSAFPGGIGAEDGPSHRVRISHPFYLAKYPTTVSQFRAFVNETKYETTAETGSMYPSRYIGGLTRTDGPIAEIRPDANWRNPLSARGAPVLEDQPVTQMSFYDACAFCIHYDYRLPTDAEYEFALRGMTTSAYWWGDNPDVGYGSGVKHRVGGERIPGWDDGPETYDSIQSIGSFSVSPRGFVDLLSNISEWCSDVYKTGYYRECRDGGTVTDPQGPEEGPVLLRVRRGNGLRIGPGLSQAYSAARSKGDPVSSGWLDGFRCAKTL